MPMNLMDAIVFWSLAGVAVFLLCAALTLLLRAGQARSRDGIVYRVCCAIVQLRAPWYLYFALGPSVLIGTAAWYFENE